MITLTGVEPASGSKRNLKNCLIEFTLNDEGNVGINSSTLLVDVCGVRALEGASFVSGFAGSYSEINLDVNFLSVIIDKEADFLEDTVVDLKVQVQDFNEKYYNFDYSFKVVSNKPYIFSSSPEDKEILVSPQKLYFDIRDDVDDISISSIRVILNNADVYSAGSFHSPFNGNSSSVIHSSGRAEITIDPEEFLRDGNYILRLEVEDISGNKLNSIIRFMVRYTSVVLPDVFPQGGFLGFYQGIKKVTDVGNGKDLFLEWSTPISRFYNSDIYSLVYFSDQRLSIFDDMPKYIANADVLSATLSQFKTGVGYYFAVRAMESYSDSIDQTGMDEVSPGIFRIPLETSLTEVLSSEGTIVNVDSTDIYPEKGFLLIGNEVIKYNAIDRVNHRFLTTTNGRGLNNTTASYHDVGESVKMFLLCQDDNNSIIYGTASYQDPVSTGRQTNSVGIIVPDFSDFEKMEHDGLDHCGYHKALPWQVLNNKNDCGSYLGGVYNGFRGMDIFQRAMDREEELMENVGEKCILMRRKWSGETCSCVTLRRQHPKIRSCKFCYGTGFVEGYDQIINLRRADKRVLIRFYEATEDLKLGDHSHLSQEFQPGALALYKPIIKDRDVIVRFDFTGDIEYIYEVLNVNRERFVFNKYGRQKLSIIRLDKTDILYQLPFQL